MTVNTETHWLIVGYGRVGRTLAALLRNKGKSVAIWTRSTEAALRAQAAGFDASTGGVPRVAESIATVIFCVPDDVVARFSAATMAAAAPRADRVWLHTSGIHTASVLGESGEIGGCHPLLAFAGDERDLDNLEGTFFALDGTPAAQARSREIVALAKGHAGEVTAESRVAYHTAAVVASNAIYAVLEAASRITTQAGISNSALRFGLARLAAHSALNASRIGFVAAATGPVIRGDVSTVKTHRQHLHATDHELGVLYDALSGELLRLARARGVPERTLGAIRAVLEEVVPETSSSPTDE